MLAAGSHRQPGPGRALAGKTDGTGTWDRGQNVIQMQTIVDVADNTGAKQAQVITVLGGSTARHGKKRLKRAGVGDRVVVTVKKALPNSEFTGGNTRKDRSTRRKAKAVVVRTRRPTRRSTSTVSRCRATPSFAAGRRRTESRR